MIIAGEASGDLLAAELVGALRDEMAKAGAAFTPEQQPLTTSLAPRFFGAGGPHMRKAGVELVLDMSEHAVIGLTDVLRKYGHFRRCFRTLYRAALQREPDAIICVDFSGFNLRFASAIRKYVRRQRKSFFNWKPRLIQYVSPQAWASRPRRALQMQRDHDLLLSILPFEKEWYSKHAPDLRVEFVGHPMVDRHAKRIGRPIAPTSQKPLIVLLPGSRQAELERHLPMMEDAVQQISEKTGVDFRMPLPSATLVKLAHSFDWPANVTIQEGGLDACLETATLAIASTGTVTLECAFQGVPTIALYKTSWLTYQVGKRIVTVKYLAMPNILANDVVYPEFIQNEATGENIAREALRLLSSPEQLTAIRKRLAQIVASLGDPGASRRGARAVARVLCGA